MYYEDPKFDGMPWYIIAIHPAMLMVYIIGLWLFGVIK